jgi:hypothetical protein
VNPPNLLTLLHNDMQIDGKEVKLRGRFIRIAGVAEGYEYVDEPEWFLARLRESGVRADLFTFTQRLSATSPRFAYPMESENVAALAVSTFDHWYTKQIGNKTRNLIRKAEKSGVSVREVPFDDSLIAGISALNNETPVRQNRPFLHYGDHPDTVRRTNGSFLDRSVFMGAFFHGNLIGYVKLTSDENQEQAGLMQIMSMIRHRDKAPTNALVAHAVRSCAERGIRYLWYARFAYRNKKPDSLADFKRHNGFQRAEVPRYYVPLTRAGGIALRLGLHHGLSHRLPETMMHRVRQLRNRWYDAKSGS